MFGILKPGNFNIDIFQGRRICAFCAKKKSRYSFLSAHCFFRELNIYVFFIQSFKISRRFHFRVLVLWKTFFFQQSRKFAEFYILYWALIIFRHVYSNCVVHHLTRTKAFASFFTPLFIHQAIDSVTKRLHRVESAISAVIIRQSVE